MIENEGINRLIHDTFVSTYENVPMEEAYENIHDVPLIDKAKKLIQRLKDKSSLCSFVASQLEGIELYFKYENDTIVKVCKIDLYVNFNICFLFIIVVCMPVIIMISSFIYFL